MATDGFRDLRMVGRNSGVGIAKSVGKLSENLYTSTGIKTALDAISSYIAIPLADLAKSGYRELAGSIDAIGKTIGGFEEVQEASKATKIYPVAGKLAATALLDLAESVIKCGVYPIAEPIGYFVENFGPGNEEKKIKAEEAIVMAKAMERAEVEEDPEIFYDCVRGLKLERGFREKEAVNQGRRAKDRNYRILQDAKEAVKYAQSDDPRAREIAEKNLTALRREILDLDDPQSRKTFGVCVDRNLLKNFIEITGSKPTTDELTEVLLNVTDSGKDSESNGDKNGKTQGEYISSKDDVGTFYDTVRKYIQKNDLEGLDHAKRAAIELGHSGAIRYWEEATGKRIDYREKLQALKNSIAFRGISFDSHETSTGDLYRELFWSEEDERLFEVCAPIEVLKVFDGGVFKGKMYGSDRREELRKSIAEIIAASDSLEGADWRLDSLKIKALCKLTEFGREDSVLAETLISTEAEKEEELAEVVGQMGGAERVGKYGTRNLFVFDQLAGNIQRLRNAVGKTESAPSFRQKNLQQEYVIALEYATVLSEGYSGLPAEELIGNGRIEQWDQVTKLVRKYMDAVPEEVANQILPRLEKIMDTVETKSDAFKESRESKIPSVQSSNRPTKSAI